MGQFGDSPFKLRTPPKSSISDLSWWKDTLSGSGLVRPVPGPIILTDPRVFSDASSGVGIGIVIGDHWRAWRLLPGWNDDNSGRGIQWAEAVGFELALRTLAHVGAFPANIVVWGDNRGVVEGWWIGRSRNAPTNIIFRRIHSLLASLGGSAHTRYVPSANNPADGPSRGIYGPRALLLPVIPIPIELRPYIIDYDAGLIESECHAIQGYPKCPHTKFIDTYERARRLACASDIEATSSDVVIAAADW